MSVLQEVSVNEMVEAHIMKDPEMEMQADNGRNLGLFGIVFTSIAVPILAVWAALDRVRAWNWEWILWAICVLGLSAVGASFAYIATR